MCFSTLAANAAGSLDRDSLFVIVFFGGGIAVVIVGIVVDAWRKSAQTKAREESRREIAAYVAEGSMSAEDAAKLLAKDSCLKDAVKDKLRSAVEKI